MCTNSKLGADESGGLENLTMYREFIESLLYLRTSRFELIFQYRHVCKIESLSHLVTPKGC